MTIDEAKFVVEQCRDWNFEQKSLSLAFHGKRTDEDDILDAKRRALKMAWQVLGRKGI